MNFYCRACGLKYIATEYKACPTCRLTEPVMFLGRYYTHRIPVQDGAA